MEWPRGNELSLYDFKDGVLAMDLVGDDKELDLFSLSLENGAILIVNRSANGHNSVAYCKAKTFDENSERIQKNIFSYKIRCV